MTTQTQTHYYTGWPLIIPFFPSITWKKALIVCGILLLLLGAAIAAVVVLEVGKKKDTGEMAEMGWNGSDGMA